jgi:alginate O-acetyltransferase complex protein AlgI
MIFLSYWFWAFAAVFFALYWTFSASVIRTTLLLMSCITFHYHFAGPAGVVPIIALGLTTYFAGLIGGRFVTSLGIAACVLALVFYKYLVFLLTSTLGLLAGAEQIVVIQDSAKAYLPAAPPLAISFFVFEFSHYLIEVRRGGKAITSPIAFTLFSIFWPSLVAGPIKRYRDFILALSSGLQKVSSSDVVAGALRVGTGLLKKVAADYLTQVLTFWGDHYSEFSLSYRWLFVVGIAFRILLDFSGYSDMAIGFARMMGIRLPENFRWPYLSANLVEFWRRWHISLSTWIRDYVYIPLGGGRASVPRKIFNALIAFSLCGLWHGADWNFVVWGLFHGIGIAFVNGFHAVTGRWRSGERSILWPIPSILGWAITMVFVMMGWLLFFYPVERAINMARLLFVDV